MLRNKDQPSWDEGLGQRDKSEGGNRTDLYKWNYLVAFRLISISTPKQFKQDSTGTRTFKVPT